jgi:hypothetical protein
VEDGVRREELLDTAEVVSIDERVVEVSYMLTYRLVGRGPSISRFASDGVTLLR